MISELSSSENYWLQCLRNDLGSDGEIQGIMERYEDHKEEIYYQALMDVIVRGNWKKLKEERNMSMALRELWSELWAEELEQMRKKQLEEWRSEAIKEGMEAGMEEGLKEGVQAGRIDGIRLAKSVFKLSASGLSPQEIALRCNISTEQVKEILE